MRVKKIKNATRENLELLDVIIIDNIYGKEIDYNPLINKINGFINKGKYENIIIEIGSGKGNFITNLAKDNPNNLYFAIEKDITTCYLLASYIKTLNLSNLVCLNCDGLELINIFSKETISNIYLNFSDPWPKKSHNKRRLTYLTFLNLYYKLLKKGGLISFRTDHLDFFNDSILYLEDSNLFDFITIDFDYPITKYMTEYEIRKRENFKINNLICKKKE